MTTPPSSHLRDQQVGAHAARRISIALCTYNGARYLEAQLESFLAQTRPPDEIVVCDDGSTDDTVAMLERFAGRASFPVRIDRNKTRLGSTKNFEKAISSCTGGLIATSDQDDVWLPRKLALTEAAFDAEPSRGLVFTNADVVDEDLRSIGHKIWDAIQFGAWAQWRVRTGHAFEVLLRQWVVTGATMTFKSEYRPFVLPIPENWVHDAWIAFIIGAMAPVGFVEHPTVMYRQHAAQQIGGRKLSRKELYQLAKEIGPPYFRQAYERFRLAHERLQAFASQVQDPRFLAVTARKVEHQRRRLAISESGSRPMRMAWAMGELLRGRYWHYSPNYKHFIKDMFF